MGRFGQQHRNLQRREAKAQMAVATGAFYVRPDHDCNEFQQTVELEDPDFRYSQRLVEHDGKLVEFALILSRFQGGSWVEVYSIDTKHGVLHAHLSGHQRKNDRRDIKTLYTQVDVQESFDDPADQMVLEMYRRLRN